MKRLTVALLLALGVGAAWGEDGFMDEHWSQTKPYNDLVPAYLPPETGDTGYEAWGGHVTAGCVATAMAQTMHYWGWPARFDSPVTVSHSVNLDKGKVQFGVTHTVAAGVPLKYDDSDECKARLTFIAATLGELAFDRDGTGGYVERVVGNLANDGYYLKPVYDNYSKWDLTLDLLKFNYPVPAAIPGHAIVLDGWKRENGTLMFHKNNGQGGGGDGWITRDQITDVYPCYPNKKVAMGTVPTKAKLPLTVTWSFPEAYLKIYPEKFKGFELVAIPSSSKGDPEVKETLGRAERSYTLEKLTNGERYSIEITPIFDELEGTDPTYYVKPETDSVVTTIDDGAGDCPQLTAPKKYSAALTGGEFKVAGSKTIENLTVTTSLKSYTIEKTTYELSKYISVEGKEGDFTVKLKPIDFLGKSDNYNVVFTFAGDDQNGAIAYAETIVNFAAANKGEGGEGEGEEVKNFVSDSEIPDYILISPSDFVSAWTEYVKARAVAHPKIKFAIKNAAEIYAAYGDKGGDAADMIKSYIAQQAGKGTKYFVLGGAWSNIGADGKCEENFVVAGENGDKYGQLALSLSNAIPGFFKTFSGKTLATDYPYSLIDGDEKADVVVARIPLVPWSKADGTVPTFAAMIEGYGKKVAAVESDDFSGRHRYACAAGQLGSNVARGSGYWPTERHAYADGYYDFFDPKHPDSATDGEIAARRRFRDYFAMNNPIYGAMVVPQGNSAADFFADTKGWEAIVAKCHGLEGEAYGTGINDSSFRETKNLVKFGIFAMPCLTGRPDRTTTWNGWENMRLPSMGVAAICNPEGGEVVGFHNTHDGAGKNDVALVTTNGDPYATQYEGLLLEALCKDRLDAGEAWMKSHQDYIDKFGTGTWHLWTAYESILYGDPLVAPSAVNEPVCGPGRLPAKVLFR